MNQTIKTPWGEPDYVAVIEDGLIYASTPSHGGLVCTRAWADANLSKEARAIGRKFNGCLTFEHDLAWYIVIFEAPRQTLADVLLVSLQRMTSSAQAVVKSNFPVYCIKKGIAWNQESVINHWYFWNAQQKKIIRQHIDAELRQKYAVVLAG